MAIKRLNVWTESATKNSTKKTFLLKNFNATLEPGILSCLFAQRGKSSGAEELMEFFCGYSLKTAKKKFSASIRINGKIVPNIHEIGSRIAYLAPGQPSFNNLDTPLSYIQFKKQLFDQDQSSQQTLKNPESKPKKPTKPPQSSSLDTTLQWLGLKSHKNTKFKHLKKLKKEYPLLALKINLASELINNPSVVILDDPLANLDHWSKIRFITLLYELAYNGRTVLARFTAPISLKNYSLVKVMMMADKSLLCYGRLSEVGFFCRSRQISLLNKKAKYESVSEYLWGFVKRKELEGAEKTLKGEEKGRQEAKTKQWQLKVRKLKTDFEKYRKQANRRKSLIPRSGYQLLLQEAESHSRCTRCRNSWRFVSKYLFYAFRHPSVLIRLIFPVLLCSGLLLSLIEPPIKKVSTFDFIRIKVYKLYLCVLGVFYTGLVGSYTLYFEYIGEVRQAARRGFVFLEATLLAMVAVELLFYFIIASIIVLVLYGFDEYIDFEMDRNWPKILILILCGFWAAFNLGFMLACLSSKRKSRSGDPINPNRSKKMLHRVVTVALILGALSGLHSHKDTTSTLLIRVLAQFNPLRSALKQIGAMFFREPEIDYLLKNCLLRQFSCKIKRTLAQRLLGSSADQCLVQTIDHRVCNPTLYFKSSRTADNLTLYLLALQGLMFRIFGCLCSADAWQWIRVIEAAENGDSNNCSSAGFENFGFSTLQNKSTFLSTLTPTKGLNLSTANKGNGFEQQKGLEFEKMLIFCF